MGEVNYEPLIRDMTWSYSRIKAFDDCPYRWYLKYIRFPSTDGKPMFFSDYGIFMHELLASFYKGERTRIELQEQYLSEFRTRVRGYAPNKKVFSGYFSDGLQYLKKMESLKETIFSVENRVNFSIQSVPFVGYIDLLSENDERSILLTDNKSRALKPRSNRSSPTKADAELDEYLKQLYLYSVAVKNIYGIYPEKLRFNCFRKGIMIEEPFSEKAFADSTKWFLDRIGDIASETEFRPAIEYFKCRYLCEMQDYCSYYSINFGK